MLSVTQLDYNNYWRVFKGNYAKGIHILANILQTPQQANDLTSNLGGVSVLLGTPVGAEDVNSKTLRTMLLESAYADNAVSTWLGGFYTFDDLGTLFADQTIRSEVFTSSLLWRAVSACSVAMAKYVTNIVGLNPADYADMTAVATSSTAMAAITASSTAMTALATSSIAMSAVTSSSTAMQAIVNSTTAMQAIVNNTTAMQAIANSTTAMQVIVNNTTTMNVVAASSTAMSVVASSSTARVAITNSATAKNALASSPLKQSVGVTSVNKVYKKLVSGRSCFVISATGRSGYGFGLRYLYTSATGYEEKTYVSSANPNMFTTKDGLEAYSNIGSDTSIGLTVYYIPC